MKRSLFEKLQPLQRPFITSAELALVLDGTSNSRYSKVKRLLKQGKLIRIRRGLYCRTAELGYQGQPNLFELAQFIYEPSYISFESALSYHGLIPEAVYSTTSASAKRSKEFKTPLGIFSYLHLPIKDFYTEVESIAENNHRFFIAKPWKAICDYVYSYKTTIKVRALFESLRLDLQDLPVLSMEESELLSEYYRSERVDIFLKNVKKELEKSDKELKVLYA